jgi:hypothetical protein
VRDSLVEKIDEYQDQAATGGLTPGIASKVPDTNSLNYILNHKSVDELKGVFIKRDHIS